MDLRIGFGFSLSRVAVDLAALAFFVALTIAMTWPLARNMDRAVSNPGDPYINTFILSWVHHSLTHDPARLAHAPIFHPHPYALAFSENLFGIALPALPLSWAALDPLVIYNVALLAGFIFSAWGAYLMGRMFTGSVVAGIGAGVFFAFLPWRFVHLPHLQHQWAGWLPLIVAALIHYWRRPAPARALIVALCFAANGATNLHWFAFSLVAAPVVALVLGITSMQRGSWKAWAGVGAAFIGGCAALVPLLLPYVRARQLYGARSSSDDAALWSAVPGDWLAVAPGTIYSRFVEITVFEPERWLFPGVVPTALSLAALLFLVSSRAARSRASFYVAAVALVAIGFIGSLGENGFFHHVLAELLPVFEGIRAPARWAMVGYLGMTMLIALTLKVITARGTAGRVAGIVLAALMMVELNQAPIRYWLGPAEPDALTLRARELRDQLVIAYLPLDQRAQYRLMLDASRHLAPMVNGVSGFAPPRFRELEQLYASGELGDAFTRLLLELGVTAVVISPDALNGRAGAVRDWARKEMTGGRLRPLAVFPSELHSGEFAFAFSPSQEPFEGAVPNEIDSWLRGEPVPPPAFVFGYVDEPAPSSSVHGDLRIFGWALAKEPIERVRVHLENGARVIEAERLPYDPVLRHFAGYEHEPLPAFTLTLPFDQRVQEQSDLEIEVITRSGRVERFGYRWFDWRE